MMVYGLIRNCFRTLSTFRQIPFEEGLGAYIRGRPFLAGSEGQLMPTRLTYKSNKYLQVVTNDSSNLSLAELGEKLTEHIDANVAQHSAILFRNLPIKNIDTFEELMTGATSTEMAYIAGVASRARLSSNNNKVYEASNETDVLNMEPHNEMCYLDAFPRKLFFCCLSAPDAYGETPVVFNRDILPNLNKEFVKKVEEKGVRYLRYYNNKKHNTYLSWQDVFNTESVDKVEEILRSESNKWRWNNDGSLVSWSLKSPFIRHPETKEKIWFNQLNAMHKSYYQDHPDFKGKHIAYDKYPLHSTYGDGEEFENKHIQHVRDVTWNAATGFRWQQGDVLFFDNLLAQHGRMSYKGNRKIVVSLSDRMERERE